MNKQKTKAKILNTTFRSRTWLRELKKFKTICKQQNLNASALLRQFVKEFNDKNTEKK